MVVKKIEKPCFLSYVKTRSFHIFLISTNSEKTELSSQLFCNHCLGKYKQVQKVRKKEQTLFELELLEVLLFKEEIFLQYLLLQNQKIRIIKQRRRNGILFLNDLPYSVYLNY